MTVLEDNEKYENHPDYRYQDGLKFSDIEKIPKQSLTGIEFYPFLIKFDKYLIYITTLGTVNNTKTGIGYTAKFIGKYLNKYAEYIQQINLNDAIILSTTIHFKDCELQAWKAMLKVAGYHEITPFTKNESKISSKTVAIWLSKESLNQFTAFLLDKNITIPSSYKVDAAIGLPIMYLKDTKELLWHQFFELHPNGMKRIAFITCLENSKFVYHDDLDGLYLICNEYGFGIFEDLIELIYEKIGEKNIQISYICYNDIK
ncbi:hypothetical protein C1645_826791 [Glomus cerebriforme]|uniref:Uncharacterized protein n=1 Tax=Glomus cerebriforme TaxID=658196 RepID=A0A397SVW0_9GLOM|nr:hypothetical protein C1645_826791 [Glomus cerebriforme]